MSQVDYYVKRSEEVKAIAFDFTTFAASVSPATIDYFLHADAGITVAQAITGNVLTLTLSGGATGLHYLFGIEAVASNGVTSIDMRRMRIREPSTAGVAEAGIVTVDGLLLVVTDDLDVPLTDDSDLTLYELGA